MEKFQKVTGIAAPLDLRNVDTDTIIPKQFLKTVGREGLGKALFFDIRFEPNGEEKPNFILNRKPWRQAKILISGENFGCGSSREHAPWALHEFGIRVIIASRFADIFYNNCLQNALLPIVLPEQLVRKMMEQATRGDNAVFSVDLVEQKISTPDGVISFDIEPERKKALLEGRDAISHTLERSDAIADFEQKHHKSQPWLVNGLIGGLQNRAQNSPADESQNTLLNSSTAS